jgi:molybdopterin converting factor subunit 1
LIAFEVLLFAAAREAAGVDKVRVELLGGVRVAELVSELSTSLPALATLLPKCRIAVNHEFAEGEQMLHPGDEIAVIPPVSGG